MYGRGGGGGAPVWSKFVPCFEYLGEICATKIFPKHFCMIFIFAVLACLQTGSLTKEKRVFWPSVPQIGVIFGKRAPQVPRTS